MILLDIFMPRGRHWEQELSQLIQNKKPETHVCVISSPSDREYLQTAFNTGVKEYICKTADSNEIRDALFRIQRGCTYFPPQMWQSQSKHYYSPLTPRQQEVLRLVAKGGSNKVIARRLGLTEGTVKRHIYNLCQTLGASNRVEAVELTRQQGLFSQ